MIHDVRSSAHDREGQVMEGIEGAPAMAPEQPNDSPERDKDALRVQAAAVSAQQAALIEDEIRIRRREKSVEEQETQLATHLDERHRKLVDLRDQIGRARTDLLADREANSRDMSKLARQVCIERSGASDALKYAALQRRRLWRLRLQLRKRLHRHWQAYQNEKAEYTSALAQDRHQLEHDRNCVRSERDLLAQMRKRLTGETELSRRQIEDAWRSYRQELERQSALGLSKRREIEAARTDVIERQQQLSAETGRWDLRRERLQMEVVGLETRVQNARLRLLELRPNSVIKMPDLESAPRVANHSARRPRPSVDGGRLVTVEQLTGDVVDQRAHLVEQWQQLLHAQSAFEEERQQSLSDLETMAAALEAQRQEACAVRERLARDAEESRRASEKMLAEHADWKCHRAASECEEHAARAEWQFRIDQVTDQLTRLHECLESSSARQSRRWQCVCQSLDGASRLRQSYVRLRRQCVARSQGIVRQEKEVAARALAIEQYWQECTSQASDAVAAEKRLESIRQQWMRALQEGFTRVSAERREFECLATAVNERAAIIDRQVEAMAGLDGDVSLREQALQQGLLEFRARQSERDRDYLTIKAHRDALAEENASLRQELEHIAAQLLDDERPHLRIAA
jgi:hypothetical protein